MLTDSWKFPARDLKLKGTMPHPKMMRRGFGGAAPDSVCFP
jgi:hypothetical protein